MSQADISSFVSSVRQNDAAQLGPSLLALNSQSMPDMLASLDQLSIADRTKFSQAALTGIPGAGCNRTQTLREAKQVGINRIEFAFRVVSDKRVPKTIPGDLYETGQMRDAYTFLKIPAPTRNVWMTCIGATCDDAQLRKKGEEGGSFSDPTIMGGDTTYGQAGWDVSIRYGTSAFASVPRLISERCKGSLIKRLGINAHGFPGKVAVNGVDEKGEAVPAEMTAHNLPQFKGVLDFLDNVMTPDGVLLFQSCTAGQQSGGSELVKALSMELRSRQIVAFTSIGFSSPQMQRRGDEACREPGARDTPFFGSSSDEHSRYFKSGLWDDLSKMPWQSETSPHAKVAKNGAIIRDPDDN